jgi:hypothetical protein
MILTCLLIVRDVNPFMVFGIELLRDCITVKSISFLLLLKPNVLS